MKKINIGIITINTSFKYDKIDEPNKVPQSPKVSILATLSAAIVLSVRINKLTNSIAITGPIEARAISPKPSSWLFLPDLTAHIPSPNDIINGTDIAPVVTPIASNDSGTKLLGAKNDNIRDTA